MSHLEKILDETFGKKKPKQVEVSLERLHPPMAPPNTVFNEDKQEYSYEVSVDLRKGIYPNESIASEKEVNLEASSSLNESRMGSTPISGNVQSIADSKLAIDFSYLANNSSFQRAIMEFIKKFVPGFENVKHRGSKEVMTKSFNKNAQNYTNVMNEYKEKVKKLQEKRVE